MKIVPVSTKLPLTKFRNQLLAERERLLALLHSGEKKIQDLDKKDIGDIVDQAYSMYEKNKALKMSEEENKILNAIDSAIKRLDNGLYGVCVVCNKQVDRGRLEALPWAATCVDTKNCANNKNPKK